MAKFFVWGSVKSKLWLFIALGVFAMTMSGSKSQIDRIAEAIATAEGYFVKGSRPDNNNNPGNLTDDFGYQTVGKDGMFPIFINVGAGWAALKEQVRMMLDGTSHIYRPDMTVIEVAREYTRTEQETWAANVARELGVTINTPINQV